MVREKGSQKKDAVFVRKTPLVSWPFLQKVLRRAYSALWLYSIIVESDYHGEPNQQQKVCYYCMLRTVCQGKRSI